jgi:hypothetical protein
MSNSIHRVNLPITDYQEVELTGPPMSVAADRGGDPARFDLWFEHYDERHREMHGSWPIYVFGTGNEVAWTSPEQRGGFEFVGSVITSLNQVWHVYTGPSRGPL